MCLLNQHCYNSLGWYLSLAHSEMLYYCSKYSCHILSWDWSVCLGMLRCGYFTPQPLPRQVLPLRQLCCTCACRNAPLWRKAFKLYLFSLCSGACSPWGLFYSVFCCCLDIWAGRVEFRGKGNSYCSVHRLQLGQYNGRRRNGPRSTRYQNICKGRRYTKQYKKVNKKKQSWREIL